MNLLSDITLNPQVLGTSLEYIKLASDLCICVNEWIPAWKGDYNFWETWSMLGLQLYVVSYQMHEVL